MCASPLLHLYLVVLSIKTKQDWCGSDAIGVFFLTFEWLKFICIKCCIFSQQIKSLEIILKRHNNDIERIKDEGPNDLDNFIFKHKKLKIITFNGIKSQALYDKYFDRKSEIKYILLSSTSPANTGIDFDNICKLWRQLVTK